MVEGTQKRVFNIYYRYIMMYVGTRYCYRLHAHARDDFFKHK